MEWVHFIGPSTNLFLSSNAVLPITSTISSWVNTAAVEPMSGSTAASRVLAPTAHGCCRAPTVKPVALVADAIKDCSNCGDLILDPFAGSGTTVIAAEKTKRRAALIEIDPLYVDVTIRRWQSYTGAAAMLADTGETFSKREHPPVKAQHENEGS